MKQFVNLCINEKSIIVEKGLTLIQACEIIGIQIPRFCYHEQLSIAGNCRMCLVEVENSVKPVAACAITVENNMKIYTNTSLVKKARESVMEFLLINHPLDCPICDQGGECDLQDQAMVFGNDRGRFYEFKRAVSELYLGPFVKTVMTRCIHCTRCVRFLSELGGNMQVGTIGRGNKTEIGSYIDVKFNSEVSGNIIDLCPVGALTAKPYAFTARAWELTKIETIDTLDSLGTNLCYCVYGDKIMRVLPVIHMGINEEWLSDKTRFSYDGFSVQRLVTPFYKEDNFLRKKNWQEIFLGVLVNIEKGCSFLINNDLSVETLYVLKNLKKKFHSICVVIKDSCVKRNIDFRVLYLFNSTYIKIKEGDFFGMIGCNLKKEMPLLLIRLRKEKRLRVFDIVIFGSMDVYQLHEKSFGSNINNLLQFREGKHFASMQLKKAKSPIILLGSGVMSSVNCNTIITMFVTMKQVINKMWNGLNCVELGAGIIGGYELGFTNSSSKCMDETVLTINNVDYKLNTIVKRSTFLGSHGFSDVKFYDLVLPIRTNIEQDGVFINNEGRAQVTKNVQMGLVNNKAAWEVLVSIFNILFNVKQTVEIQSSLYDIRIKFNKLSCLNLNMVGYVNFFLQKKKKNKLWFIGIMPYIVDVYGTTVISKNSRILLTAQKFFDKNNYNL